MGINVGIDLGTTYSAVAVFDDTAGQVKVLKNSDDKNYTPSVTHIENGKVTIGDEAKQFQASGDLNSASFYKSMMGEKGYTLFLDGKEYTPEELSGLYLRELINDISRHNNVKIDGAVITCPAYFNEAQRVATRKAGEKAGLKVLKIINEPTAAIIAYGLTGEGKKNVMVYDLGGGTFDVTIAEVNGTHVKVLTTNGNHQLGGKNWDAAIADELKHKFFDEFNVNIEDNPEDFYQLKVQCEDIKKRLTNLSTTTAVIQCQGYTGKYEVTREFFDSATHSLLNETSLLVDRSFSEIGGGFSWKNLDEVVLVGGSTRMLQVKEFVKREYGREPVTKNIDVDTIVASGAAMQAKLSIENRLVLGGPAESKTAALGGKKMLVITGGDVQDITSHSLGMLALAKDNVTYVNSIIIKKNSPLKEKFGKPYSFSGEKMDVYVLQGEFNEPRECTILYKYCVSGFTKGKKTEFELFFEYNQDGVVDVTINISSLKIEKSEVNESVDEVINRLIREREERRISSRGEIMFMVDTSGSMSDEPIKKARAALHDFVKELDLTRFKISILNFSDSGRFECSYESDIRKIERAISSLSVGTTGGGNDETPLTTFGNKFKEANNRIIVVLTDGVWNDQRKEEISSDKLRAQGIVIYAVGFGGADERFLNKIASEKGARKIDLSKLSETFVEIADSIATEI
jgi:molecular chaperone DnaK (HSP70)